MGFAVFMHYARMRFPRTEVSYGLVLFLSIQKTRCLRRRDSCRFRGDHSPFIEGLQDTKTKVVKEPLCNVHPVFGLHGGRPTHCASITEQIGAEPDCGLHPKFDYLNDKICASHKLQDRVYHRMI